VLIVSVSVLVLVPARNCLNASRVSLFTAPSPSRLGVLLSALFVWLNFFLFTFAYADDCQPQGRLDPVRVERAVDGDTLALTDGRRVRLIGFNSPEKSHQGRPAEPLASAAQTALAHLVVGKVVYLQLGQEPRDHYGRLLAHAFLSQRGDSVEAAMLREGWGFQVIIAPNNAHAKCFADAESQARTARRGVWANAYYQPIAAANIDGSRLGFVRITGTIESASLTKAALWLSLPGEVVLRIKRDALTSFGWPVSPATDAKKWQGKKVLVRGWLTDRYAGKPAPKNRQRYLMSISDPLVMDVM
jgi:micrococcal nuclease